MERNLIQEFHLSMEQYTDWLTPSSPLATSAIAFLVAALCLIVSLRFSPNPSSI